VRAARREAATAIPAARVAIFLYLFAPQLKSRRPRPNLLRWERARSPGKSAEVGIMNREVLRMLRLSIGVLGFAIMLAPNSSWSEEVPDALSVEWHGKKLCENLYEDSMMRILWCTLEPGDVHVRHSHPALFGYVLKGAGGKGQVVDEKGTRTFDEDPDGEHWTSGPNAWHEVTNIGNTTLSYLIVEKKY
jgi:quercetin dioxygenase-like cupin family protein